jgi:hypothetical protein
MKALAAVLIVVGVAIVVWGAFGFTTREKVVDIGPIHASKETAQRALRTGGRCRACFGWRSFAGKEQGLISLRRPIQR